MSNELRQIIPTPPPPGDEIFATQQVSSEFHHEVQYRQAFEQYCEWYYATAMLHRQELQKMRREFNIFGLFIRNRR